MGILRIPDIPRYGIVLEKNLKESIFKEVYEGAARSVIQIIKHNQENETGELFLNSTVVFTGDRGSGKSSAMNSFAAFLEDPAANSDFLSPEDHKVISDNKFYILQSIDATQMGPKETLLGSISAKMYQAFKDTQKKYTQMPASATLEKQREFIRKAQRVNRLAYMYQTGDWYKDNDELLQNTAGIESLKPEFHELVECFLDMMCEGYRKDKTYLVIVVDDIDMSLGNSFDIVDEIRKFLTEKNIIVLSSVYMKQLKSVLASHFANPNNEKCYTYISRVWHYSPESLAEKYIEKIFPISRQHRMPQLSFEQLAKYTVENLIENERLSDSEKNYWKQLGIIREKVPKSPSIMNGVLHLIYKKTLLLLLPNEYSRHWIIPRNIRSLVNMIMFLRDMEDVAYEIKSDGIVHVATNKELQKKRDVIEKNLNSFMRYIVDEMSTFEASEVNKDDNSLALALEQLIRDIPDWSAATINAKIVRDILYHINGYTLSPDDQKFYSEIFNGQSAVLLDASKHSKLVSMGDVMYVLGKIDSKTNSWEIKRLIEIVRVVWSIRATKEFFVEGINQVDADWYCGKNITRDFRHMVGGFMVNPDTSKFLPYSYENVEHRGDTDWIFCKFEPAKYSLEERERITEALNLIYVFQPACDFVRAKHENEKSIPVQLWRTYDNHELAYFERNIQANPNEPIYLALNFMAIFTNMLSINILGNRIMAKTVSNEDENKEEYLNLNQWEGAWQSKYVMFFPFYSMDFMYCLYNRARYESLATTRQYSDLREAFMALLDIFSNQVGDMEKNVIKHFAYIFKDEEIEKLRESTETMPLVASLYNPNSLDSFKNQYSSEVDIIFDYLDVKEWDANMMHQAIDQFISKLDKTALDEVNKMLANYKTELDKQIKKYSPYGLKRKLLAETEKIDTDNYKSTYETLKNEVKKYDENRLEAYVY